MLLSAVFILAGVAIIFWGFGLAKAVIVLVYLKYAMYALNLSVDTKSCG